MRNEKYEDENGNLVLAVSSSVPYFTAVPVGMTPEDAIPITEEEHTEILEQVKEANAEYVDPIEELKAKVDGLQADVTAVKEVTLDTIPNKDQV